MASKSKRERNKQHLQKQRSHGNKPQKLLHSNKDQGSNLETKTKCRNTMICSVNKPKTVTQICSVTQPVGINILQNGNVGVVYQLKLLMNPPRAELIPGERETKQRKEEEEKRG